LWGLFEDIVERIDDVNNHNGFDDDYINEYYEGYLF
jgi:hypothetical protein